MTPDRLLLSQAAEALRTGHADKARGLLDTLLAQNPAEGDALFLDGMLRAASGDNVGALAQLRAAARVRPGDRRILQAIAQLCEAAGDWPGVEAACNDWSRNAPTDPQAQFLLGESRRASGDADGAIAAYGRTLALDPWHLAAHNNLAALLTGRGLADRALPHLRAAAQLAPSIAGVHYNLAMALAASGETIDAIQSYRRALQLDPRFANAYLNLGILLHAQGRLDDAEHNLAQAASLAPQPALALANLGTVRKEQGRVTEALADCVAAIDRDPDGALGWSNLFVNAAYADPPVAPTQLSEWMRTFDRTMRQEPKEPARRVHKARLRLGYVSADFRDHAVNYFFEPTLACHDRSRFDVYCYDCNPHPDTITARLRATPTVWRSCAALDDAQLAARIEEDGIDLLIDLMGHTAGNRLGVFARRPAPLQGSWLGWPARTGLGAIDFRIADRHIAQGVPDEPLPGEVPLALPHTWLCYRPDTRAPNLSAAPIEPGRPITFGSFNAICKLGPSVVSTWSRLLAAVPASRLLIVGVPTGQANARLRAAFASHGIGAGRLKLVAPCPVEDFFAQLRRTDVALDPFPFNGSTTSLHALWLGVPVVTLSGTTHAGRMGCSLLRNAGLDRLVADSIDDYVNVAARLAGDAQTRGELRTSLRERLQATPLLDEPGFARDLEDAYLSAWQARAQTVGP